jgi:hypothetical protein
MKWKTYFLEYRGGWRKCIAPLELHKNDELFFTKVKLLMEL